MLSRSRPRSNDDANSTVRGGARTSGSTTPQSNHQTTCPRAQSHTRATSTHTRAGAPTFPSSCLDGGVTRVRPGQNPQYTPAPFGEDGVGCSQTKHHSTPPRRPMNEPTTLYMRRESLAIFHFFTFSYYHIIIFSLFHITFFHFCSFLLFLVFLFCFSNFFIFFHFSFVFVFSFCFLFPVFSFLLFFLFFSIMVSFFFFFFLSVVRADPKT